MMELVAFAALCPRHPTPLTKSLLYPSRQLDDKLVDNELYKSAVLGWAYRLAEVFASEHKMKNIPRL